MVCLPMLGWMLQFRPSNVAIQWALFVADCRESAEETWSPRASLPERYNLSIKI